MKPLYSLLATRYYLCTLFAPVLSNPGCKQEAPPPAIPASTYAKAEEAPPTYAKPSSGGAVSVTFTDITAPAGIKFTHVNGAFGSKWMPETIGGGGAFFDYDGDQKPDILLVNSSYWPGHEASVPADAGRSGLQADAGRSVLQAAPTSKLYRNKGDGSFEDVSEASGLSKLVCYGMGACAADYDGDGDNDVFITAVGKDHLLRNDAGKFVDVTDEAGVGFSTCAGKPSEWEWSTGATWLDHDRDGDLDLFVCNYVHWTPETDVYVSRDGKTKSYSLPDRYQGATNVLFRNEGDGKFTDVSKAAGVFNPDGKSMSVLADDFNDDGWPDLFVSNDTQPNFLYLNQKNGAFVERGLAAGVAYDEDGRTRAGMGVAIADMNNKGARSIAIGNFSGEPVSLYTQEGLETFIDKAGPTRLAKPTTLALTFGLLFADFNLDGYEDLLLANGHIEPEIEHVKEGWEFAQLPQLFVNNRAGQFIEMTAQAGEPFQRKIVARCAATADIDGDGDLDVLLTVNGGPAKLLRNDLPRDSHLVRVRLAGSGKNTAAIGARLRAKSGGLTQTRFVRTGGSYLSQSEFEATFGLADATAIDALEIRWPDGQTQTCEKLTAGALYVIQPGDAAPHREPLALAVAPRDRG